MTKVVARVDANAKEIIVRYPDGRDERYGTVTLQNAEFGSGMIRGDLVETFKYRLPSKHFSRRAYFNRNKVSRYVDRDTQKVLAESAAVYMTGSSVLYI